MVIETQFPSTQKTMANGQPYTVGHESQGSSISFATRSIPISDQSTIRLRPMSTPPKKIARRTVLGEPNSKVPVVAVGLCLWLEATHAASNEQIPDVPFPINDDFSVIGNWYLADSTDIPASDPRAEVHRLWGLALWDMAKSDATLFGCVAMLTLHKRQSIASRFDKVLYLDHKQHVYENLCKSVASSGGNIASNMALAIALLAFAEVREGNFADGRRHIRAIAAMDCVCQLDEVQWRLVVWCDLRYAMKTATLPTLRYYLPPSLTEALTHIDAAIIVEARRSALGNWRHLKKHPELDESIWFQMFISLHIISILANSRTSVIQNARLATAYEAEYQAHTIAANLETQTEPRETRVIEALLVVACQLHILATTSSFAPSTVEVRETLLSKARSGLTKLNIGQDAEHSRTHDPALLWALSTFATHSMDGGFEHSQLFIEIVAAVVDTKRLPSKCAFERLLRAWPWTDTWHTIKVPTLWAEILVVRGRRWRCIATEEPQETCAQKKSGKYYAGNLLFYGS
jgi:hypothetical protein